MKNINSQNQDNAHGKFFPADAQNIYLIGMLILLGYTFIHTVLTQIH